MPINKKVPWLLCYDVADPKRLQRVHRIISKNSTTFQYSVYFTHGTRREILQIIEQTEPLIDPGKDDLRVYPVLTTAKHYHFGRSMIADGIYLFH